MAIREAFGQAVIGSAEEDLEQTLIQIHRPEINIVSAYRPQDPAIESYLRGLDIENRYMRPTTRDPFPHYGIDPAFFFYNAATGEFKITGRVPEGEGREQFLNHANEGARIFGQAVGVEEVLVKWRVIGQRLENSCYHIDNGVTYRGLETILDEAKTLWLPDQYADWNSFQCGYDEKGFMNTNLLKTTARDHAHQEQVERHHMTIHKGGQFPNPLFHAMPSPFMNVKTGTRSILTYDIG